MSELGGSHFWDGVKILFTIAECLAVSLAVQHGKEQKKKGVEKWHGNFFSSKDWKLVQSPKNYTTDDWLSPYHVCSSRLVFYELSYNLQVSYVAVPRGASTRLKECHV